MEFRVNKRIGRLQLISAQKKGSDGKGAYAGELF